MKEKKKSAVSWILTWAGQKRIAYVWSVLLAIGNVIFKILPYFIIADVVKLFLNGEKEFKTYLAKAVLIALSFIIAELLHSLSTALSHKATFAVLANIRKSCCDKLVRVPLGYVKDTSSGTFKNIMVERIDSIETTLAHIVPEFTSNLLAPVVILIYFFLTDWRLALWSLVPVIVGLFSYFGMMLDYKPSFERTVQTTKDLNDAAVEYIDGIEVIKAFGKTESSYAKFTKAAFEYADSFILEQDREEFLNWHTCRNMKRRLCNTEKITYHYQSVSETEKNKYYEAYAVQGKSDEKTFTIFLGYRSIDSILYKEKATQKRLEKALEEAELRNEIISSIAKTYQYISRIDIQADWFEEISNKDKEQLNFINSGVLSVNNKKVYRQYIAEEYQEAFFKFTDISTLPERMKNEETIAMEYRMKDGNWHKLRFIEKKRDTDGNLTHVLCAIRSISAAKKREASLLYQVAEAKKDAALKSRFLSNMSHDIRTPMNGIIGMIDLANHYPNDLEMQQKCRDQVLESSKHLVSLVSNILDMSKLESGDIIEQELDFDLTEVLSRANTDKQILAEEKNIDYVVDWKKGNLKHVYLVGNPAYLERLLTIVADNAVKFTEPGGTIHVWCWEKSVDDSHVMYEFVCEDNGIGMSEEFISHAFEMFSQENETSRTKYEGAGLGLAIAKKIVERMEGTIEIKSKKGSGTTVTMTLPFKIGQPEKNEISKTDNGTRQEMSFEGMRALIAEDNELNMEIAKFMLENNGIRVECAADGEEAVKKFEKAQPGYYDVIFMDIMMPNMNGWDAARKIRSMKRTDAGTIPIIAMSANAFSEDIINSRISGMNQHLTKPLEEAFG